MTLTSLLNSKNGDRAVAAQTLGISEEKQKIIEQAIEQAKAEKNLSVKMPSVALFGVRFPSKDMAKIIEFIAIETDGAEIGFLRVTNPVPLTFIKIYREYESEDEVRELLKKLIDFVSEKCEGISVGRIVYIKWNGEKVKL